MYLAGTEINLKHKALEIYLSGCKGPHCPGCHNEELWDFRQGLEIAGVLDALLWKAEALRESDLAKMVWVMGGEPLDQERGELLALCQQLSDIVDVMLWTHYEQIPPELVPYLAYAKLGPYVEGGEAYTEPVLGITLANREQRVVKIMEESNEHHQTANQETV